MATVYWRREHLRRTPVGPGRYVLMIEIYRYRATPDGEEGDDEFFIKLLNPEKARRWGEERGIPAERIEGEDGSFSWEQKILLEEE